MQQRQDVKRLILICGANGIGKSTACKALAETLGQTAYIDSDYCRFMYPFSFTQEEVAVVISNISTMMINYFRLSTIENVLFQYGFHGIRKSIFDSIRRELSMAGIVYEFCPIILRCSLEENIRRMQNDGRDTQRIKRAIENTRAIYDAYDFPRLDITHLTVSQTVAEIMNILASTYPRQIA